LLRVTKADSETSVSAEECYRIRSVSVFRYLGILKFTRNVAVEIVKLIASLFRPIFFLSTRYGTDTDLLFYFDVMYVRTKVSLQILSSIFCKISIRSYVRKVKFVILPVCVTLTPPPPPPSLRRGIGGVISIMKWHRLSGPI
jgi:hypothetical protein